MSPLRVGVDATSMAGNLSGVGHTTASLVDALVGVDEGIEVTLLPVTVRGAGRLRAGVRHPRVRVANTRLPARAMSALWSRADWPPAELFCGEIDVFWGPNFVLPPLVKAAGVLTIHDLAFVRMPEACSEHVRTYAQSVPRMAARANRIVTPSRAIAEEVSGWLPDEAGRITVVHPGVRRAFRERGGPLTLPRRQALGIREPYAVFVGNLEVRKNVDVLLQSFSLVRAVHPKAQLVLIGAPGVGWDTISAKHAALLDSEAVRPVGYLPDEEVTAIIRGAKVFVYPSRYEGFGIPPLEAMATGTPVVATKIPSLEEALGPHARFVHPDDTDGLATAIAEPFEGKPLPGDIEAARAWAYEFTWGRSARTMLEVFADAMKDLL